MICPPRSELEALLRQPAPAAPENLARHLEECPACRDTLERLAGGTAWRAAGGKLSPPSTTVQNPLVAAIVQGLQSEPDSPATPPAERLDFLGPATGPDMLGTFGPYEILSHVASGGMGVVLKARDPALNRIVALKVLAPNLARRSAARSRFIREARAAAAVVHDHVVSIHAVDEANGLPYLVMQFIKGRSLAERLQATGPMRLEEILRIGSQIASGLAAAHTQGLIHRDVKPGNVLLENGVERVKLTDFGLARAMDDTTLTCTGEIAGTPEYMSPEQATGAAVDARSDLFSLGCILYAMATGTSPFRADTSLAVLRRVCDAEPVSIRNVNPALPAWFEQIVSRLLAKSPADRFQTAAELEVTLTECLQAVNSGRQPSAHGSSLSTRASAALRSRGLQLAAATALILVAVGGLWRMSRPVPVAEGATEQQPPASRSEPFAIIGLDGSVRASFAQLQQAVDAARPGEIVELHRSGKFSPGPIRVRGKALTIRAAATAAPEWQHDAASGPALDSDAPLVLEGILFTGVSATPSPEMPRQNWHKRPTQAIPLTGQTMVRFSGRALLLAHCQFRSAWEAIARRPGTADISVSNAALTELRHCRLVTPWTKGLVWRHTRNDTPPARLVLTNCVMFNEENLWLEAGPQTRLEADIARTLFRERAAVVLARAETPQSIRLTVRQSVFSSRYVVDDERPAGGPALPEVCQWEGRGNLFSERECHFIDTATFPTHPAAARRFASWKNFWPGDVDAALGQFALESEPPQEVQSTATPGAFFVNGLQVVQGPGDAAQTAATYGLHPNAASPGSTGYARWRRSPEYNEWRDHVTRTLAEQRPVPPSAQNAAAPRFTVLNSEGGKKFSTLAEAVAAASSGQTIEIAAEGRVEITPVQIAGKALRLRAAEGTTPVLYQPDPQLGLLTTDSTLVLEGLAFERAPAGTPLALPTGRNPPALARHANATETSPRRFNPREFSPAPLIQVRGARFEASHCRFAVRDSSGLMPDQSSTALDLQHSDGATLRHCELQALHAVGVNVTGAKFQVQLSNCVFLGRSFFRAEIEEANTSRLAVDRCLIAAQTFIAPTKRSRDDGSHLVISVQQSVLDVSTVITIPPALRSSINLTNNWEWRGAGNTYSVHEAFLNSRTPRSYDVTSLAEWRRFWPAEETDSIEQRLEFPALPLSNEVITDFRASQLQPHPPARHGCALALVGPGDAFARWRHSPEYPHHFDAAPR